MQTSISFSKSDQKLRQRVLTWLENNVSQSRIDHIVRVEEMAIALAEHHGVSVQKAAQAGLMHDLAKFFKPKRLLEHARADGLEVDAVFEANPHLLHATVGAIIARDEFGVGDRDILDAIANHTLGCPGMNSLSCIVFLSDSLEPGRGDTEELNTLRQLSFQDLDQAVWMTCDYTIRYLLEAKKLIHPRAIATRNWFLQSAKNRTVIK
ncbi:MAG: bis(5'-nucleosyl)-tetraphosphatase (symmetrical) YqeK [Leptolyngbyaceae bacterium]|nr:bis(5'-nucleosyl)-tetraphosphatase (symmetrical) YqeK [Leptolyngbyaceae bacterium]